jgi:hypothetical protein
LPGPFEIPPDQGGWEYHLALGPDVFSQVGCNSLGVLVNAMVGAMVDSCAGETETTIITDPQIVAYTFDIY